MGCGIDNGCLHFRRSASSLAGRSPQRGRVGEGVALAILLQSQNRPPRGRMRERSPQFPPIGSLPLQGRAGVGLIVAGCGVGLSSATGDIAEMPCKWVKKQARYL